mmetsp:Transcript_5699/g.20453  ORF Transcript_5699/g.20453 Transcript_5699/m.20453 type:complete len:567 (-) Transcript_5699:697-2397(-)
MPRPIMPVSSPSVDRLRTFAGRIGKPWASSLTRWRSSSSFGASFFSCSTACFCSMERDSGRIESISSVDASTSEPDPSSSPCMAASRTSGASNRRGATMRTVSGFSLEGSAMREPTSTPSGSSPRARARRTYDARISAARCSMMPRNCSTVSRPTPCWINAATDESSVNTSCAGASPFDVACATSGASGATGGAGPRAIDARRRPSSGCGVGGWNPAISSHLRLRNMTVTRSHKSIIAASFRSWRSSKSFERCSVVTRRSFSASSICLRFTSWNPCVSRYFFIAASTFSHSSCSLSTSVLTRWMKLNARKFWSSRSMNVSTSCATSSMPLSSFTLSNAAFSSSYEYTTSSCSSSSATSAMSLPIAPGASLATWDTCPMWRALFRMRPPADATPPRAPAPLRLDRWELGLPRPLACRLLRLTSSRICSSSSFSRCSSSLSVAISFWNCSSSCSATSSARTRYSMAFSRSSYTSLECSIASAMSRLLAARSAIRPSNTSLRMRCSCLNMLMVMRIFLRCESKSLSFRFMLCSLVSSVRSCRTMISGAFSAASTPSRARGSALCPGRFR